MSNGFKASRHVGGGCLRLAEYTIDPTNTTTIWNGDAVSLNGGNIEQGKVDDADLIGTFLGCMYVNARGEQKFSPFWDGVANQSDIRGLVIDDKEESYRVVDASGALAVGDDCDLIDNGSENAAIGASTMTVGASTNAQFKVRKVLGVDRLNGLAYVEVVIN